MEKDNAPASTPPPSSGARIVGEKPELPGPGPQVMAADTLQGSTVVNPAGESLGEIEDIMIDVPTGRIAYAVLSFGGVLGIGNKLFAVPWDALTLDAGHERFILDIERERLKHTPGFDKSHWPSAADPGWKARVESLFGRGPDSTW